MSEAKAKFGDRWLTVKEAAEYTRTDEDWILDQIKSGALKFVPTARRKSSGPKGPKRRIIDRRRIDSLMESLEIDEPQVTRAAEAIPVAPAPPKPRSTRGMSSREMYKRGL